MIEVSEALESSDELVAAVGRLVREASSSAAEPTAEQVAAIVASPASHLLLAREDGEIVGMLTLVTFPIPTGVRAWIEDVVVTQVARGKGVGEELTNVALGIAADAGARTVDLTSRPNREAANRLYARLGFALRETNVYRYSGERA